MVITSSAQALEILDDVRADTFRREAAIRYLGMNLTPPALKRLVQALQDDDFSVRWEAASVLGQQGESAVLAVLKALTDPQSVGDPRMRECAYHILHSNFTALPVPMNDLLQALHGGPAADIASLIEAHRVLRAFEKYRLARAQAKRRSDAITEATQLHILSQRDGLAQLTGRLGRLGKPW